MPFTDKDMNLGYEAEELAHMQRVYEKLLPLFPPPAHTVLRSAIINEAGNCDDVRELMWRVRNRLKLST